MQSSKGRQRWAWGCIGGNTRGNANGRILWRGDVTRGFKWEAKVGMGVLRREHEGDCKWKDTMEGDVTRRNTKAGR